MRLPSRYWTLPGNWANAASLFRLVELAPGVTTDEVKQKDHREFRGIKEIMMTDIAAIPLTRIDGSGDDLSAMEQVCQAMPAS